MGVHIRQITRVHDTTITYIIFLSSVSCTPLDGPDNGVIDCTGSVYGDTCSFTCDDGYELIGSDTRTCQSDGNWNGSEAKCEQGIMLLCGLCHVPLSYIAIDRSGKSCTLVT